MKFWKRWVADIRAKTVGCSLAELGAYDRLLDEYYMHEKPLPQSRDALYRICAAMTQNERQAVDKIASEFFFNGEDGLLHNKRADAYLAQEMGVRQEQSMKGSEGARKRWGNKKKSNGQHTMRLVEVPAWLDSEKFSAWIKIRPAKARTPDAQAAAIEKLDEFRAQGHNPNEIVKNSLANGWQGIFAPNGIKGRSADSLDERNARAVQEFIGKQQ